MKAIIAGFAAIVVISFGAYFALTAVGVSSEDRTNGNTVRID